MRIHTKKLFVSLLTASMVTGLALSNPVMADRNIKPDRVTIAKASMTVAPGKEFEIKATMSPRNAEDEYLRWEILSGKDVIHFDDDDRNDDEIEFKALKEGTASVRCYVKGKDKTKYGDTIKISVQKKNDYTFQSYGKLSKTVEVDDDLELKVKKGSSIKEKQLKWTIANKKLLRFEDGDNTGKEVELEARRPGTTEVTCTYTDSNGTKKSVTYTVKVIPERDED